MHQKPLETLRPIARISFDELVDFFYARTPKYLKVTEYQVQQMVAHSLKDNLCYWSIDGDSPIVVVLCGVYGRWINEETVEILLAAGNINDAWQLLAVFREQHPTVKYFTYYRKSKLLRRKIKVQTLWETLTRRHLPQNQQLQ